MAEHTDHGSIGGSSWNDKPPDRIHHAVQVHQTGLPTYFEYIRADLVQPDPSHADLVAALEPLAKIAGAVFFEYETGDGRTRVANSNKQDEDAAWGYDGVYLTYGDLRKARDLYAALTKAGEAE